MARVQQVVIDQVGAGTTTLLAAQGADWQIDVINYVVVMSAEGTFAFSDGTDWLSGDMPVAINGGVSAAAGSLLEPLMQGGKGRPFSITTTGGSAHGHALVRIQ